jgi:hypothetical protein
MQQQRKMLLYRDSPILSKTLAVNNFAAVLNAEDIGKK